MNNNSLNVNQLAKVLTADMLLDSQIIYLALGRCTLSFRSNSSKMMQRMGDYFSHILCAPTDVDIEVIAVEQSAPQLDLEYIDWKREAGKVGRKDSYFDFPGGRIVRKVRTGMVFLQSESQLIAAGPCLQNDNQVINFINAQYMNLLQQRNWQICHAAGLVVDGKALAIAGFSGGGKSTLMLHTLDNLNVNFLSNDRLLIKSEHGRVQAAGIPKQPRINPGTIIHSQRLQGLIDEQRTQELRALPAGELWDLEEKYDVMIDDLYGPDRITTDAPLAAFLVLTWHRDSDKPLNMQKVNIEERRDLLGAIMKSPGPFYQHLDGSFHLADVPFDESAYIDILKNVVVYEASGRVDFQALADRYIAEALGA